MQQHRTDVRQCLGERVDDPVLDDDHVVGELEVELADAIPLFDGETLEGVNDALNPASRCAGSAWPRRNEVEPVDSDSEGDEMGDDLEHLAPEIRSKRDGNVLDVRPSSHGQMANERADLLLLDEFEDPIRFPTAPPSDVEGEGEVVPCFADEEGVGEVLAWCRRDGGVVSGGMDRDEVPQGLEDVVHDLVGELRNSGDVF